MKYGIRPERITAVEGQKSSDNGIQERIWFDRRDELAVTAQAKPSGARDARYRIDSIIDNFPRFPYHMLCLYGVVRWV